MGQENAQEGQQGPSIPKIPSTTPKSQKKLDSWATGNWNHQTPWLQKWQKQVSPFRSCTWCVQGSAQKQDAAEPQCRPPSLTLSVHGAREGPAPRAQVSSLWALPCPLTGVSDPLEGADALPCPSSPGGITAADLVKPRAKRPRAAAGR